VRKHKEFKIATQLLKSGTSVGAKIRESEYVQFKADFNFKLSIKLKESNETEYWLNLLRDAGYLQKETADSLIADINELIRMLISSLPQKMDSKLSV